MANGSGNRGVAYTLIFINQSTNTGSACIYQDPNIGPPHVLPLAWFARRTAPTTRTVFSWTIDYNFVWAETGELIPGVLFAAAQVWAADLMSTNQVTFSNVAGMYTFQDQQRGPQAGSLFIREDASVPPRHAAVGIGMSGAATFAVQAQPNMNLVFAPNPKYYITFGDFFPGEVLDVTSITDKAEIDFPPNVYSMSAFLREDNTWLVEPTAQANIIGMLDRGTERQT